VDSLLYPKPQKRKKDAKLMKQIHQDYKYKQCEACKQVFSSYVIHHKIRRSQSGNDEESNFAYLCKEHDSMLHFDPVNFRKQFGLDIFLDLLPSLRTKYEYNEELKGNLFL